MNTPTEQRAAELFLAALDHHPKDRGAFIDRVCNRDAGLRARVEALLAADDSPATFLRPPDPAGAVGACGLTPIAPGTLIGRYRVCQLIAAGGMGAVYEAEQDHPQRIVALKVMKQGVASRSSLRRFEYESQILARLRHSGIAQVFDAGMYDDGSGGVPYFVMEFIPDARTLTDFARAEDLGTRRKLDLFTQVCDAVHHGHQKGIIHRDLKPANILVDSAGLIKIIDFGVARATDSDLVVTTLQTDVGQLVGTLQYMSPEQVEVDPHDLDVRSDVYSLGVVLYELLCCRLPYDVSSARLFEAARLIREQSPARPSTLDRALRGDLETIVLKALEKDRARRYQSAADLGQDIKRYLSNQPIAARPPSMTYQLRTFARRNKMLVGGVAAIFFVLLSALVVVSILLVRIQRESSKRAEINQFLESLLITADGAPFIAGGNQPRQFGANAQWVDAIDDAVARLDQQPLADEEAEAAIRHRVGMIYVWMWKLDEAYANLQKALTVRQRLFGDDHPDTLDTKAGLAWCKNFLLDSYEAERLALEVVDACTRLYGPADRRTFNAMHLLAINRYQLAYQLDFQEVAQSMLDLVEAHPEAGLPHSVPKALMAQSFRDRGMSNEAEAMAREAVAESEIDSPFSITHAWSVMQLGWIAHEREDLKAAEELVRQGIEIWGSRTVRTIEFDHSLVNILCAQPERLEEGLALARQTLRSVREQYGDAHPYTAKIACDLAHGFFLARKWDEAEAALRLCLLNMESPGHVWIQLDAIMLKRLGENLEQQRRFDEAEAAYRRAIDVAGRFTPEQWRRHSLGSLAWFHAELAGFLARCRRHEEADTLWAQAREELLDRMTWEAATRYLWLRINLACVAEPDEPVARALVESLRSDSRPSTHLTDALNKHAIVLDALGRQEEALAPFRERFEMLSQLFEPTHRRVLAAMNSLAWQLDKLGRPAEAEPIAREAVARYRQVEKPNVGGMIDALDTWAVALRDLNRLDEAAIVFDEMAALWRHSRGESVPLNPVLQFHRAVCLLRMHRYADAEAVLLEVLSAVDAQSTNSRLRREALDQVVVLYESWGKPEKAAEYRQRE